MRRILSLIAIPVLVAALFATGAGPAVAGGRVGDGTTTSVHPPTCC